MAIETFVYEGQEVVKTGRIAEQQVKTINNKVKINTLVEITPKEPDGWKKWVNPSELFTVKP